MNLRRVFVRMTVSQLADMWRGAAEGIGEFEPERADQLRKCAKDLENTHFYHELVKDNPLDKSKLWWRLLK